MRRHAGISARLGLPRAPESSPGACPPASASRRRRSQALLSPGRGRRPAGKIAWKPDGQAASHVVFPNGPAVASEHISDNYDQTFRFALPPGHYVLARPVRPVDGVRVRHVPRDNRYRRRGNPGRTAGRVQVAAVTPRGPRPAPQPSRPGPRPPADAATSHRVNRGSSRHDGRLAATSSASDSAPAATHARAGPGPAGVPAGRPVRRAPGRGRGRPARARTPVWSRHRPTRPPRDGRVATARPGRSRRAPPVRPPRPSRRIAASAALAVEITCVSRSRRPSMTRAPP